MLRRSPCEVYIKYLLLSEERYTNEQIIDMLVDANLDYLNQNYLNKLRQKLIPPEPFRPRDPRHTPSQKFLLREGLFSLFDRQEEKINAFAFSILDRPRAKEFVEALLISGTPPAAIAKRLFTMGVPRCPTAAVERYRYLFWNLSLIDSVDVKHLLHLRSQQVPSGLRGEERDAFLAAAKKASYHDPRMMAAQLPQSPAAALLVQAKMGLPVGKGDLKFFLESIFAQATGRLYVMLSGELPEAEMRDVPESVEPEPLNPSTEGAR